MKIVILAGDGGSNGLKGHIKGFLSACSVDSTVQITVICTPQLTEFLHGKTAPNVKLFPLEAAKVRISDYVLHKPLSDSVQQILEQENPDFVLVMSSILRKGLEKYRTVLELHNQLYIDTKQLRRMGFSKTTLSLLIQRYYTKRSMKQAEAVIFDSAQSMRQTKEHGFAFQKGIYVHYGIEPSERQFAFENAPLHDPVTLIYVSAIFPYKNQIPLVRGIAELKKRGIQAKLHLVGSGPAKYEEKLKQEIQKLGVADNIVLHSWVEHDEIKHMIDESDIFVYSSSVETSGFGLMEGMARGAVIACNAESCMPEVLGDGGELFDVHSPQSTADALQKLIENPKLRAEYAKKAFDISAQYTWENHARKIFATLKEMLGE